MKARITRKFTDYFLFFSVLFRVIRALISTLYFPDDGTCYCFFSVNSNFCNPNL